MKRRTRGAALLESVIALGVLAIGTAAIVALVTEVHKAGTKSSYQTASLDLFAGFSSQVRAASCDILPANLGLGVDPAATDPGLLPSGTPYTGAPPVAGTAITLVGDFTQFPDAPPMRLTYQVSLAPISLDAPPMLEIDATVRELVRDPLKDTLAMGSWIRNFRLTKVCNLRTDNVTSCGAPPCGRGEFY